MKKALTAVVAIIIVAGAVFFFYNQMKKLGYFGSPAPAAQSGQDMMMPPAAPGAPGQPAEGQPADTTQQAPAPAAQDTTAQ
jgi:hypothetical protein